mmetsp:Transcript_35643/g.81702  ORF Transcript_35643/g.81702 Transcript_35643/m.81702 type:complete len:297 (-) Transcript_35643:63-953(-)
MLQLFSSQKSSEKRGESHEERVARWNATIEAIEAYEKEEWKKITPGTCRLTIYWIQMLGCGCECIFRWGFHGLAWLFAAIWVASDRVYLDIMERVTGMTTVAKNKGERLSTKQLAHHQLRIALYGTYLPQVIVHNLQQPWQPFFFDGADVSIFRPGKPRGRRDDCCDCCQCCRCCYDCCALFDVVGERYIRSSFCCLSGHHSCHCGVCLGPCASEFCYVPCQEVDGYPAICKYCEPEETRIERWMREGHAAKLARTQRFFEARPDLMRPSILDEPANKGVEDAQRKGELSRPLLTA